MTREEQDQASEDQRDQAFGHALGHLHAEHARDHPRDERDGHQPDEDAPEAVPGALSRAAEPVSTCCQLRNVSISSRIAAAEDELPCQSREPAAVPSPILSPDESACAVPSRRRPRSCRRRVSPDARARARPLRRAANETPRREHERDGEARQRRADLRVRRVQPREEVRPEAEILRLREPLVDGEAGEPRRRSSRAGTPGRGRCRRARSACRSAASRRAARRRAARRTRRGAGGTAGSREVERERADGRDRGRADDEPRAAAPRVSTFCVETAAE